MDISIPILQMRKLRLWGSEELPQGNTATNCEGGTGNREKTNQSAFGFIGRKPISDQLRLKKRSISSGQFSRSVMSDSLWPHGLQHTRPPCPSPTPGVHPNPCPSSRWCHPLISSSVVPFSSHLQSFPASGSFPMSQFFASSGQSIGISASASVLPMNIQDWFPLGCTGWISLQSKGLSSLLHHHSSKVSILWGSAFFLVQLSQPYMTTGKTVAAHIPGKSRTAAGMAEILGSTDWSDFTRLFSLPLLLPSISCHLWLASFLGKLSYVCKGACVLSHFSRVRLFAPLWTVACQAPLSMGFSRQEYWRGLPCPPPGDLPDPGI